MSNLRQTDQSRRRLERRLGVSLIELTLLFTAIMALLLGSVSFSLLGMILLFGGLAILTAVVVREANLRAFGICVLGLLISTAPLWRLIG